MLYKKPQPSFLKKIFRQGQVKNLPLLVLFITLLTSFLPSCAMQMDVPTKTITFHKYTFNVEIADTEQTQSKGLMFRKSLQDKSGMLFVFPEEKINVFWMKNTYFPLDILWLDQQKKVVFLKENTLPRDEMPIVPPVKSLYVLEINAGWVEKMGLKIGDSLVF